MADHYLDKIIYYGNFKENLDKVVDVMRSERAGSLILRGNPGSGKRSLIEEAQRMTKVRCVYISSHWYTEDYTAMKAIAEELGFKARGAHIGDLMDEIKASANDKQKLVIVLLDFEEFCRKRQSLLYNLMNLIHTNPTLVDKGVNLTLIGLTISLDWAENIEKRVRSRLNADCLDLDPPYTDNIEYIRFASQLVGGYKFSLELVQQLDYMYSYLKCTSMRTLKKFLNNIISCDKKGKVSVNFDPKDWNHDYQLNTNTLLRNRLSLLTRSQLDLLKLAVNYCFIMSKCGFSLHDLDTYHRRREFKAPFLSTSQLTLWDLLMLWRLKLVKPAKCDQPLSQEAVFFPAVTPVQFPAAIDASRELQSAQTDLYWRPLK